VVYFYVCILCHFLIYGQFVCCVLFVFCIFFAGYSEFLSISVQADSWKDYLQYDLLRFLCTFHGSLCTAEKIA